MIYNKFIPYYPLNLKAFVTHPLEITGLRAEKREAGQDDINRAISELHKQKRLWLIFNKLDTITADSYFYKEGMNKLFTFLCRVTYNVEINVICRVLHWVI